MCLAQACAVKIGEHVAPALAMLSNSSPDMSQVCCGHEDISCRMGLGAALGGCHTGHAFECLCRSAPLNQCCLGKVCVLLLAGKRPASCWGSQQGVEATACGCAALTTTLSHIQSLVCQSRLLAGPAMLTCMLLMQRAWGPAGGGLQRHAGSLAGADADATRASF